MACGTSHWGRAPPLNNHQRAPTQTKQTASSANTLPNVNLTNNFTLQPSAPSSQPYLPPSTTASSLHCPACLRASSQNVFPSLSSPWRATLIRNKRIFDPPNHIKSSATTSTPIRNRTSTTSSPQLSTPTPRPTNYNLT